MRVHLIAAVSTLAFAILSQPGVARAEQPVQPCPTKTCAPQPPLTDPTGNPVTPYLCDSLSKKGVPQHVIDEALRNPAAIYGWGILHNPNVPASPYNTYRRSLTIRDLGQRYGPHNGLIFKSGCS